MSILIDTRTIERDGRTFVVETFTDDHGLPWDETDCYYPADYQRFLDFAEGRWSYVGLVVYEELPCCPTCGHSRQGESVSLWGIESDDEYYMAENGEGLDELVEEALRNSAAA